MHPKNINVKDAHLLEENYHWYHPIVRHICSYKINIKHQGFAWEMLRGATMWHTWCAGCRRREEEMTQMLPHAHIIVLLHLPI